MAALTRRSATVTFSRGPKGMNAWQLLLDWLTPAARARLTRAVVGIPRHVTALSNILERETLQGCNYSPMTKVER